MSVQFRTLPGFRVFVLQILTWNCILLRDMEYKRDTGAGIACSVQWLDSGLGHSGFEFRQGQYEIFCSRKLSEWLWGLPGLLLSGHRDSVHGAKLGPTRPPTQWTQGLCARGKAGAYPASYSLDTGTLCTGQSWGLPALLLNGHQGLCARGKAGAYPASYSVDTRDCLHGAKLPGRQADESP
jgi:hypothetical protein